MTLGTADPDGTPWVSPVWYAHENHREFLWVSRPEAQHSRNIATRPQVAIVIFNSTVSPATGQAVYLEATAEPIPDPQRASAIATFSAKSAAAGAPAWTVHDVAAPAEFGLLMSS
ncbi:MAG: pyridoxamine 5'-phosphate oxidase family protein, partial [Solirubrobacteraceae bacterium]